MAEASLHDPELAALAIKQARGDHDRGRVPAARPTARRFRGWVSACRWTPRRMRVKQACLVDLQGHPGRPAARPELRLHAAAARPGAGRTGDVPTLRCAAARTRRGFGRRRCPAQPARAPGSGGLDRTLRAERRRPRAAGHHPRPAALPDAPHRPAADAGPCGRGLGARHGLFDATRPCLHPSVRRRDPPGRGDGRAGARGTGVRRASWARSTSPSAGWSTSSAGSARAARRSSPAATAWCFGEGERKAMAMSLVDRALRAAELEIDSPAQQQEYALSHGDSVEASGSCCPTATTSRPRVSCST